MLQHGINHVQIKTSAFRGASHDVPIEWQLGYTNGEVKVVKIMQSLLKFQPPIFCSPSFGIA
jgi:hypothetical protein